MRRITLLLLMLFAVAPTVWAQVSDGGTPFSLQAGSGLSTDELRPTIVPTPNWDAVRLQDEANQKDGHPPLVGTIVNVGLTVKNSGVWTELPNGDRVWRLRLDAPGAQGMVLYWNQFQLPMGAKLWVYAADKKEVHGAFTHENNGPTGLFATEMVHLDQTVVEYYEPKGAGARIQQPFVLSEVGWAFRLVPHTRTAIDFGDSEPCEVNVNCVPEGNNWQDEKRAVARILLRIGNGFFWCTGSLVNNVRQNCDPYFLTALHCGDGASVSDRNQWIFYFNYEAAGCINPANEPVANTITGCTLNSDSNDGGGNTGSDFLLVTLSSSIPANYNAHFAGWNANNVSTPNGVGIHHPAGDIKKISTFTSPLTQVSWGGVTPNTHWQLSWVATANGHGVTEGGSSGSPIFNSLGQIVGTLTGGSSFCNTPTAPDQYGKMSYHWQSNGANNATQLKPWLDPDNTQTMSINGRENTCIAGCNFTVSVNTTPDNFCYLACVGTATATVQGGTAPFTYAWNNGGIAPTQTNYCGPQFTAIVTVTDATGCSATASATGGIVTQAPAITITGATALCGAASTTLTAGGAQFYVWSNGQQGATITVGAGTYTVTGTTDNGCTSVASVTVVGGQAPTLTPSATADNLCYFACVGNAFVAVSGVSPYTYAWSNGGTNALLTGLCGPANLSVTVTDATGCSASTVLNVALVTEPPTIAVTGNLTVCGGGTTTLTAAGSGTYVWSNGAAGASVTVGAGTYTVTGTTDNGCTSEATVTVQGGNAFTIDITGGNDLCPGETTTLSVTDLNADYAWSTGATNLTIEAAIGTYSVTATDAAGCSATATYTVNGAALQTIFAENFQQGIPGTFTLFNLDGLTPAAGVSYVNDAWIAREDFANNVADTCAFSTSWYEPNAGQSDDWMFTSAISLTANTVLNWSAVTYDPLFRDGYEVRISTTGPNVGGALANPALFSIVEENTTWTTRTVDLAAAGYANQTVWIAFRNNSIDKFLLLVDNITVQGCGGPALEVNIGRIDAVCNAPTGFANALVTGGTAPFQFVWSNAETTQSITPIPGYYEVTVTDVTGQTATDWVIIQSTPAIAANITADAPCTVGNSVVLTANNGFGPEVFYLTALVGEPWQSTDNLAALNDVFGFGQWTPEYFESADVNEVFDNGTRFVFLEGSDLGAEELQAFVSTNQTLIENWVAAGGRLFINAAANEGTSFQLGFGGLVIADRTDLQTDGVVLLPGTPIFTGPLTPVGPNNFTGNFFAHGTVSGTGLFPLIEGNTGVVFGRKVINGGSVYLGSMSIPFYHSPTIDAENLRRNILYHGAGLGQTYTYEWSDGSTNQNLTVGQAGTYQVTITNIFGCTGTANYVVAVCADPLEVNVARLDAVCNAPTGFAEALVTGGTAPFSYLWSTTETTQSITPIPGSYDVTVTDATGQTATDFVIIQSTPGIAASIAADTNCINGNAVNLTATVGFGPEVFYMTSLSGEPWSMMDNVNALNDVFGLGQWTQAYFETATAADIFDDGTRFVFLEGSDFGAVEMTDFLAINQTLIQNWVANGGRVFINAAATEGTDIPVGFGDLVIADRLDYQTDGVVLLPGTPIFTGPLTPVGPNNFTGNFFAHGTVSGTGLFPLIQGNTGVVFGRKVVGNGSVYLGSLTIPFWQSPALDANNLRRNTLFHGAGLGQTYTYNWSNGSTDQTIATSQAGVYEVTITNIFGCTGTASYTVQACAAPLEVNVARLDAVCNAPTGFAEALVTGGTAPFAYAWSNGETTQSITPIPGLYDVTVTDATGQTATDFVIIQSTPGIAANIMADTNCIDGNTVNLTATVGFGPEVFYMTSLSGEPWAMMDNINALNDVFGLGQWAQAYFETATAADIFDDGTRFVFLEGSDFGAVEMTDFLAINQTLIQNWVANGGRVFINAAATEGTDIPVGFGDLVIADRLDYQTDGVVLLPGTPIFTGPLTPVGPNFTGNYFAHGTVSGTGLFPLIQGNTGVVFGRKVVGNGSVYLGSLTIPFWQSPALDANNLRRNTLFHGAGLGQTYTYNWSNGSTDQTIATAQAGVYEVTITNIFGCTGTATYTVSPCIADSMTVFVTAFDPQCGDSTGILVAEIVGGTPDYTYAWSNGATDGTIFAAPGTYTLTVTDAFGATASATGTVNPIVGPTPTVLVSGDLSCLDTLVILTVTNGNFALYAWSGPGIVGGTNDPSIFAGQAGVYTVTVVDFAGCSATAEATVNGNFNAPFAEITPINALLNCANPTIDLTATGGGDYAWSNGATNATITVGFGAVYVVTVTDPDNGCTAIAQVTVGEDFTPPAAQITGNLTICGAQTTDLTATGGVAYSWSTGATTATVTVVVGTYTVTVTGDNGCVETATAVVDECVIDSMTVSITVFDPQCGDSTGILVAEITGGTPDYTYAWSNGATDGTIFAAPGTYTLTVTDAFGATASATAQVNPIVGPTPTVLVSGDLSCLDTLVILTVTNGNFALYAWSGPGIVGGTNDPSIFAGQAGVYTVTVVDFAGCSATAEATVNGNLNAPFAEITPINALLNCANPTIDLTATGGGDYAWSNGATNATITVGFGTVYVVTVTDPDNGCTAIAQVTVGEDFTPPAAQITGNLTICGAQTTDLTATGGVVFSWSTGETTATVTVGVGTYTVTVTGDNGCVETATAEVTATDLTPPTIDCPVAQTLTDFGGIALPDYAAQVVATDNCSTPTVTQSPAAGTVYNTSQTVVVFLTATDDAGNTSLCSFTVDVVISVPACEPDAAAVTWFVDDNATGANNGTSWANAFTSLQSALAAATNGSNILVAEGTYYPTTGVDRNVSFVLKAGVDLFGGYPNGGGGASNPALYPSILSGNIGSQALATDNSNRVVRAVNVGNNVTVCGFTIRDAYTTTQNSGGIYVQGSGTGVQSSPSFSNCIITNNFTSLKGGGVFVYALSNGTANPSFDNCAFNNNIATNDGGGFATIAQAGGSINVLLTNSSFTANSTPAKGGGIVNWGNSGGTITMNVMETSFDGNTAQSNGGAVWNYARSGSTVSFNALGATFTGNSGAAGGAIFNYSGGGPVLSILDSCLFEANSATSSAGAVSLYNEFAGSNGSVTIDECIFSNNLGLEGGALANLSIRGGVGNLSVTNTRFNDNVGTGRGGALFQSTNNLNVVGTTATTSVVNSVFYQNISPNGPGGVFAQVGVANTNISASFMNSTFYGNVSNGQGSAMFNSSTNVAAGITITNSVFWDNSSFLPSAKPFWNAAGLAFTNVSYSLLEQATCAANAAGTGSLNCGAGMLYAVSPNFVDAANGDLHLLAGSPAIDAGTLVGAPATDYDDVIRPQGNGVDMGAYEAAGIRPLAREIGEAPFTATLFPNPTTGAFTVSLDREVTGIAQVFDLQGRLVTSQQLNGANNAQFELNGEASGMYLVRIVSGELIVTKKVTVNKP